LLRFRIGYEVVRGSIVEGLGGEKVRVIHHLVPDIERGASPFQVPVFPTESEPSSDSCERIEFHLLLAEPIEFPDFPERGDPGDVGKWLFGMDAAILSDDGGIGASLPGILPGFDVRTGPHRRIDHDVPRG